MGEYQKAKNEGRIGSRKDLTWSKELHIHTCCKSKHSWYHKPHCPALEGKFTQKQNNSKEKMAIADLKKAGMNSLEIAEKLNMTLEKVNMMWN